MYKLCKTERSAQRQRLLEQGLLNAMCTQHFDEISVSDLCDRIGVPRKSFYRYFSGKDGALYALIDHTLLTYDGYVLEGKGGGKVIDLQELERFFLFWKEQKPLVDALTRSNLSGLLVERMVTHAIEETLAPRSYMSHHAQERRSHAIVFTLSGLLAMMLAWHHEGYREDAKYMAEIAMKLVTEPLLYDSTK